MSLAWVWACFPARDRSPCPALQTSLFQTSPVSIDCAHLRLPAALSTPSKCMMSEKPRWHERVQPEDQAGICAETGRLCTRLADPMTIGPYTSLQLGEPSTEWPCRPSQACHWQESTRGRERLAGQHPRSGKDQGQIGSFLGARGSPFWPRCRAAASADASDAYDGCCVHAWRSQHPYGAMARLQALTALTDGRI